MTSSDDLWVTEACTARVAPDQNLKHLLNRQTPAMSNRETLVRDTEVPNRKVQIQGVRENWGRDSVEVHRQANHCFSGILNMHSLRARLAGRAQGGSPT